MSKLKRDYKDGGQLLKEYRKEKNISQKNMALGIQVSAQFLCDIEKNRRRPSQKVIRRMSQMMGVDNDFLDWKFGYLPYAWKSLSYEQFCKLYNYVVKKY